MAFNENERLTLPGAIKVPDNFPKALRDACEPCRAVPRAPAQYAALNDQERWASLRAKRAIYAARWRKRVAGTHRVEHVDALLERFGAEHPPTLLEPEVEATWMWLVHEGVRSPNPELLIIDFWVAHDIVSALENFTRFAGQENIRGYDYDFEPLRRLRAHLSVANVDAWERARSTAAMLAERATRNQACLLAYLFPEDSARSNRLLADVSLPKGWEHLLALSATEPEVLLRIVQNAACSWKQFNIEAAVLAWVTLVLGEHARSVLEVFAARLPQETTAACAYLGISRKGDTPTANATILKYAEADARLDGALTDNFRCSYDSVLFVDGDLSLKGDFLDEIKKLGDAELIAIAGNLIVDGDIALYDSYPGLWVGGKTTADSLQGGDTEIYIGAGRFKHCVYGYHNDGTLKTGAVETPWVINEEHDLRVPRGNEKRIDNYRDDDEADFTCSNIPDVFIADVVDLEYDTIKFPEFLAHLRVGKPVLRSGAKTATEAALAGVEALKETRATRVDLSGKKLKAFPKDVLAMPWLVSLVLDKNAIGTIPEEIGNLVNLEELSLKMCGVNALPATIGKLKKLRVLRVERNATCYSDRRKLVMPIALPEELGDCESLEELEVSSLPGKLGGDGFPESYPYELPESIGKLKKLRKIIANYTNLVFPESMWCSPSVEEIEMRGSSSKRLPDGITSFSNLKKLDVTSTFMLEIPASITKLTNLEELRLNNAFTRVKGPLPDFGKLPRLRVLEISGNTDHTGVPVPPHELLRPIFAMDLRALERLDVSRWGPKEKGQRRAPTADLFAGIGRFIKLKVLNLEFNKLSDLPEDIYSLSEIVELKLQYNALPRAVRQRIMSTWPNAKIDLRNQDVEGEEPPTAVNRLIKEGNNLRDRKQWAGAIAKYDEALAQFTDGSETNAYLRLYALYSKMWIANQTKDFATGEALARRCLELVPPVWQIWHFTDEGQFHREVVRYATNLLAWNVSQGKAATPAAQAEALELIDRGLACADGGSQHLFLRDTKVRLLLAMKRDADAWPIVENTLAIDKDFVHFKDLENDERYKKWLASRN